MLLREGNWRDGIKLEYIPESSEGVWDKVEKIRVTINMQAWENIRRYERFGTRYDGFNTIEIIMGLPGVPALV